MFQPAILALADGSIWQGYSIGVVGETVGEVVFNTAMSGYQEIITDPSYAQQIITFSYPHIGNVGCNLEDNEASSIHAAGVIVRDCCQTPSNWRQTESLSTFLQSHGVIAIAGLDTRALVQKIATSGAQHGCIMAGYVEPSHAVEVASHYPGLLGMDLASTVSTHIPYLWSEGLWALGLGYTKKPESTGCHMVVYDYGVKQTILRQLSARGCRVTVVPAKTLASEVMALKPDGILLSNGPGDPAACDYAIQAAKELIHYGLPILGICLGHQILAIACGLETLKMKFGHHGANHPVQNLRTKQVIITSQNHGFAVGEPDISLPIEITHRSLFDGTIQGFRHKTLPIMGIQGHPEAAPGPHDFSLLFDEFLALVKSVEFSNPACVFDEHAIINE